MYLNSSLSGTNEVGHTQQEADEALLGLKQISLWKPKYTPPST
jgi:hypothetical protein